MSLIYTLNTGAGRAQVAHCVEHRRAYNAVEARLRAEGGYQINADIGPKAWLELDSQVVQLIGQEADVLFADLMPLAQSVNIGKFAVAYKKIGDMDAGETSLTGQVTHLMGQTGHNYGGILVPTHVKAFGRSWRETEANRSIGMDDLADDQAAVRLMTANFIEGNANLVYQGFHAYGLKNNPGTQGITLQVDFTSNLSTFAAMDAEFGRVLGVMRGGANRLVRNFNIYISPEIEANWRRRGGTSTIERTFMEVFQATAGVAKIAVSNELSGNQMIGFVASREFIRPVVGQAVGTTPVPRLRPFDDFQFVTWGAAGLQIIEDDDGRSGVFYAAS
jgi:hypothetical protein